jgi:hypothetical protein
VANVVKIDGVIAKLRDKAALARKDAGMGVVVGFTAAYALWVHEAPGTLMGGVPRPGGRGFYWDPQGKAGPKFLERPARELRKELAAIVREATKGGRTLLQGLLLAGLRLQRESMLSVPVDFGNLKASAFTRTEKV